MINLLLKALSTQEVPIHLSWQLRHPREAPLLEQVFLPFLHLLSRPWSRVENQGYGSLRLLGGVGGDGERGCWHFSSTGVLDPPIH